MINSFSPYNYIYYSIFLYLQLIITRVKLYGICPAGGGSLKVPSVQELAKQNLSSVPPRYIRSDQDPPFPPNTCSLQIPAVDLQLLLSQDHHQMNSELQKLHFACHEWGFFQVTN